MKFFLVENYPPDIGVYNVRINEIVNTFSKLPGVEIKIISYISKRKTKEKFSSRQIRDNVLIARYGRKFLPKFFYMVDPINPIILLNFVRVLSKELKIYDPDIVITSTPSTQPTIATYLVSRFGKKQYCIDFRDNWINKKIENSFGFFAGFRIGFSGRIIL